MAAPRTRKLQMLHLLLKTLQLLQNSPFSFSSPQPLHRVPIPMPTPPISSLPAPVRFKSSSLAPRKPHAYSASAYLRGRAR